MPDLESLQDIYNAIFDTDNIAIREKKKFIALEADGSLSEKEVPTIRGLSSDTKPEEDVELYQKFLEMDTGDVYYFDSAEWKIYQYQGSNEF